MKVYIIKVEFAPMNLPPVKEVHFYPTLRKAERGFGLITQEHRENGYDMRGEYVFKPNGESTLHNITTGAYIYIKCKTGTVIED